MKRKLKEQTKLVPFHWCRLTSNYGANLPSAAKTANDEDMVGNVVDFDKLLRGSGLFPLRANPGSAPGFSLALQGVWCNEEAALIVLILGDQPKLSTVGLRRV